MKKLQRLAIGMGLLVATTMTTPVAAQQFKTLNNTPAAQLQATEMAQVQGQGDPWSYWTYWYLKANSPARDSLARASQGINAASRYLCVNFGLSCSAPTPAKVVPAKAPKPSSLDIRNGALPGRAGGTSPSQSSLLSRASG